MTSRLSSLIGRSKWILEPPSDSAGTPNVLPDTSRSIPSLDGLRAISISLVLLGHLGGTRGFPVPESATQFFALGTLGVRVFFVISGFLITTLLLDELATTGTVNLRRFYFRRTLRIFPPYYAFLAVVGLLALFGLIQVEGRDLLHALTYTSNYHLERGWNLGHTWSLAVEEQFYLLWPAVLLLLGRRKGLIGAMLFILAVPLIRLGVWYLAPGYRNGIGITFETVGDALAVGCVLAGVRARLWTRPQIRRLLASGWVFVAVATILLFSSLERPRIDALVGSTLTNVAIAIIIERCVRFPDGRAGKILNLPSVRYVGVLSYSIYLWQQLFLNREGQGLLTSFPLNVAMTIAASLASYYLIERRFLEFRRSYELRRRRSRPSADVAAATAPIPAATPPAVETTGGTS